MNRPENGKIDSIHTIQVLTALFSTVVLLMGCNDNRKKSKEKPSLVFTAHKEKKGGWPSPDFYASAIPLYEKFTGLELLFRFDNDTTYVVNFWATWCKTCIKELSFFKNSIRLLKIKSEGCTSQSRFFLKNRKQFSAVRSKITIEIESGFIARWQIQRLDR